MSYTTLRNLQTAEPPSTHDDAMRPPTIGITLLYHPNLTRVGEVAPLVDLGSGATAEVSRLSPIMQTVDGRRQCGPLGTTYLSRTPLSIEAPKGAGIRIKASSGASQTVIDGLPLEREVEVPEGSLRRGIVLELAKTVVVLLHPLSPTFARPEPVPGLLGDSANLWQLVREIRKVAQTDVPVLLRGETGVGKELVARAIHDASARKGKPYLCVNMAAIPSSTAGSALFGHKRGAFTDATKDHRGYFQQADHGSLFLDELGDTPASVQPLLLRATEGEIQMLGEPTPQRVDVRLIAATDLDLESAVVRGDFRVQLQQRLAGYELFVAPLRERRDDVARLLLHFLRIELEALGRERLLAPPTGEQRPWLRASIMAKLCRYDWPGNVRELRNVARQLAIAHPEGERLTLDDRLTRLRDSITPTRDSAPAAECSAPPNPTSDQKKASDITDDEIILSLRTHKFNASRTAAALGASRTWLLTRMELCPEIRKGRDLGEHELRAALAACDGNLSRMVDRLEVSPHALKQRMTELGIDRRGAR